MKHTEVADLGGGVGVSHLDLLESSGEEGMLLASGTPCHRMW